MTCSIFFRIIGKTVMCFFNYFKSFNMMLFGCESSQSWWAREHNWLQWERWHEADTWSHQNLSRHGETFVCFVRSLECYYQFVSFLFRAWLRAAAGPTIRVHARSGQFGAGSACQGSRAADPCKLVVSLVKLLVGSDSHPERSVLQGWAWGVIIYLNM